jgi:hypothetical protein
MSKVGFYHQKGNKRGTIYVLKCEDYFRIGFTTNLKRRFRDYELGLPFKIELLFYAPGTVRNEYELHMTFKEWLVDGKKSWYHLNETTLALIRDVYFAYYEE